MSDPSPGTPSSGRTAGWCRSCHLLGLVRCLPGVLGGCAAVSNPVGDGIPARFLPPETFGESKDAYQQIPLTYLRQPAPEVYRLAPGDVLGVWVEGVLGD